MPEEPKPSESAPEPSKPEPQAQTPPETTTELPAESSPPQRSAPRRFVAHRATQLVAAGVVGLLVGGGAVGLIDVADDDRERAPDTAFRGDYEPGDRAYPRHPRMWRDNVKPWREEGSLRGGPLREHHHDDEDGRVVPGPKG